MSILAANVAPDSITVITADGNTMTITSESHRNYNEIREATKEHNWPLVQELIDLASQMAKQFESVSGSVRIKHGILYFGERAISGVLGERAVQMHNEGFNMDPLFAFVENLYENPSKRSVTQLYGFLEATDLPITEDGHFLAYKMISKDYKDLRTGTMDNSIGAIPEMNRNECDEDPTRTCSTGLHFCSQKYLGFYSSGHRTVIVKVNPRDVVSIPTDYNNSKGRACRYEIVGEFEVAPTPEHSFNTSVADKEVEKTGKKSLDDVNTKARAAVEETDMRPYDISGGVKVYTDNAFKLGDVVYKNAIVKRFGVDIDELLDELDVSLTTTTNDHGTVLVVVNAAFKEWIKEYLSNNY